MQPYDYLKREPYFSLQLQETSPYCLSYKVTFPSAHPSHYQENNTAHGEYFIPCIGKCFPLAIFLHGLGDESLKPYVMLARDLAKIGVASFALHLVLRPQGIAEAVEGQLSTAFIDNWLELFQVLVINARQVIDWAENRNELDGRRVAVIGTSMGGTASAIAMGVDKRITAGVFLITGGNLERITWSGKSDITRMGHKCTQAHCHEVYSHYPQYLADVAEKGIENVTPVKECFLFDPITFAPYLRGRPLLMINAEWDEFVPRYSTLEFWEACGSPRIVWLPANHATIYRRYRSISREITAFIGLAFEMEQGAHT